MQYDLKHTRKNRVTDPDQRADYDDGNADDTRVGDELLLRGPRDLLHLCDDFPQEFDYFSHDRGRLLRLFVRRVLTAELAVLAELQTIRIVLLVLVRAIVAAMALRALQRDVVAHEYPLSSISSLETTLTNLSYLENAVNVCRAFSQKSIKEPPKRGGNIQNGGGTEI